MSRALAKMAHLGIFVVTQTYPKNRSFVRGASYIMKETSQSRLATFRSNIFVTRHFLS